MSELLSQRQYAKHIGRSQPYVSKMVSAGRIPTVDGKIDPVAADAAMKASHDPAKGEQTKPQRQGAAAQSVTSPPTDTSDPLSYNAMRTRRERFLAQQAELDYRRAIGEVCEVAAATKAVMDCAVATRRLVEQIPNRIANQLAAAMGADVRRVQPMMQAEIERICDEISSTAQALPEKLGATSQ